jgi:non-specific serine/threonine protein kinase
LRLAGAIGLFWTLPHYMEEGRDWLEMAVAMPGAGNAPAPLAKALNAIGVVGHWQGDFTRIIAALERAIALRRALGDELGVAEAIGNLANAYIETGDLDRADALYAECMPVYEAADKPIWVVETLLQIGQVAGARGDYDRAAEIHADALARARRLPGATKVPDALLLLGWTHLLRGDLPAARAIYAEALAGAKTHDDRLRIGRCVRGAAGVAAADGDPTPAARLFAAAAAQRDKERMGLRPTAQAEHDRLLAGVRAALGEREFAAAWAAGYAMPLDEAAADAAALFAGSTAPPSLAGSERLTRREAEVLRLLAEGRSDKEIANALSIATRTASKHVAAILAKFGVPSRAAAAAIAARERLV